MVIELLLGEILKIISSLGYGGILLLMTAESTVLPVPSEAVLPFAGYLVAQGQFNFWITLIIATIGTVIGSLISYYIGKILGSKFVERYGKYVFLKKHDIDWAHKWFEKHGEKMIFVCRFIPAIRHVISLPAGTAEMKIEKFIAYTAAGGFLWNAILLVAGMQLGREWESIAHYAQYLDLVVILIVVFGIAWFILRHMKKKG